MVKSDTPASVWDNYPRRGSGGTATSSDLEQNGWLAAGASRLLGPNVHAYSDIDDNDFADAGEEIAPPFSIDRVAFNPAGGGCVAAKPCTWNHNRCSTAGTTNRRQNAVQAFYFANRFHDHLAARRSASVRIGSFDAGSDPLELQTDDGAAAGTAASRSYVNNANMLTPPDGAPPVMQMYLWQPPDQRTVNGGDDASIVYHEYTHGLSNRLVTDAAGRGALNSPQAGAMGEGWSDWYAKDYLVSQFPGAGQRGRRGGRRHGPLRRRHAALAPHARGSTARSARRRPSCPGADGGLGRLHVRRLRQDRRRQPRSTLDGEIWAETLWDLRTAVGSADARRLITDGMRLSPAEPSFLDMRNAILLADQAAGGGLALRDLGGLRRARDGLLRIDGHGHRVSRSRTSRCRRRPPTRAGGSPARSSTRRTGVPDRRRVGGDQRPRRRAGPPRRGHRRSRKLRDRERPGTYIPSLLIAAPGYDSVGQRGDRRPRAPPRSSAPRSPATGPPSRAARRSRRAGQRRVRRSGLRAGRGDRPARRAPAGRPTRGAGAKSMVVSLPAQVNVTDFVADPAEACGDDAGSATARLPHRDLAVVGRRTLDGGRGRHVLRRGPPPAQRHPGGGRRRAPRAAHAAQHARAAATSSTSRSSASTARRSSRCSRRRRRPPRRRRRRRRRRSRRRPSRSRPTGAPR